MRKAIHSDDAPSEVGIPLSQAILYDLKFRLEISGQIGIDPTTGKLVQGIKSQTEQSLTNIDAILNSVGWGLDNVIKVRIYLADMADYKEMNEVYAKKFPADQPARIAIAVKGLPMDALVEIECLAAGDKVDQQ